MPVSIYGFPNGQAAIEGAREGAGCTGTSAEAASLQRTCPCADAIHHVEALLCRSHAEC
jgi:hydroxymethylpyrimidine/phosphomethylpyrimidine kinase